jgi:excisionase family DNA binding protein
MTTTTPEDERPTIGTAEAARLLDLHPETVRTWVREGRLHATKIGGRNKFRRVDIEALLSHPETPRS